MTTENQSVNEVVDLDLESIEAVEDPLMEAVEHVESTPPEAPSVDDVTKNAEAIDQARSYSEAMYIVELDEIYTGNPLVQQELATTIKSTPRSDKLNFSENLSLPFMNGNTAYKYSRNFPNVDFTKDEKNQVWGANFYNAMQSTTMLGDMFSERLTRPGSEFRQFMGHEGKKFAVSAVKIGSDNDVNLTGERAVQWVRAQVGLGGIIQVPLWHSGFWVSIKGPNESDLLALNDALTEDKNELGRAAYGLAFSTSTVFMVKRVTDFIMDHLFESSLKDVADPRPFISSLDMNILVWGMACAIWRNGFKYSKATVKPTGEPGDVITALLALPRLFWIDNSAFSDWQKSHMASRNGRNMPIDSIEKYRREFTSFGGREIVLSEELDIKMSLKVPNIIEYIDAGQKWVNNIISRVDDAMGVGNDDGRRQQRVANFAKASGLRQYSHWIETIIIKGRPFRDVPTIENILDDISSIEECRTNYFTEIIKFINDSTNAIVALPSIDGEDIPMPRFPHLIPIDSLSTFFTLLGQRVEHTTTR